MAARSFFKIIPLDAYVLCVPITYACCAMGGLVYKTLKYDPEQSTMKLYEEGNEDALLKTGETWRFSVLKHFYPRIKGHESWSVPLWSNEVAVTHPHP